MLTLFVLGCAEQTAPSAPPIRVPPAPEHFPARLPAADFIGAKSCATCHKDQYEEWRRSPHGRAMAEATPQSVLGAFDGRVVDVPGGTVTPYREGDRYFMRIASESAEVVEIARVIGSGRQHQVYLDRAHAMLPLIWITVTRTWISSASYQRASADPESADYWRSSNVVELGCLSCHLSQGRRKKRVFEWTDLPINCESCHGPGRDHSKMSDLHAIGKEVDVAICAQCHARKNHFYLGREETPVTSLAHPSFRADGTQLVTAYQTAGHLLSRCFTEGAMSCSSCHDPHAQTARDLTGAPARGGESNQQCVVCHRDRIDERSATAHARHPARKVFCVDCHMPFTWMMDDPALVQRTSDHSVSIPRPRETIEHGLPNACTTCHSAKTAEWALAALEKWGRGEATKTRPWVAAIARAKRGDTSSLRAVITSTTSSEYVRRSALELLLDAPFDAELAPLLSRFTASEDASLRSIAYRLLMKQDLVAWRARGLADESALVRLEVLLASSDPRGLPLAAFERGLEDLLAHDPLPPAEEFLQLAKMLEALGRKEDAARVRAAAEGM